MEEKSISLRAELSVGRSVGSDLHKQMKAAKESVFVLSPYLHQNLLDDLLKLQERHIKVDLVTTEDSVRERSRIKIEIAKKLVSQLRHRDEAAVTLRRRGMLWSALSGIGAAATAISLNDLFPWAPLLWLLLPVAAIIFLIFWKRGIYHYEYEWRLGSNLIMPSPYKSSIECPFVHAKLYIIDKKVAFLGSLNFTKKGLFENFETCLRVDESEEIRGLELLVKRKLNDFSSLSYVPATVGAWLVKIDEWREHRAV